MGLEPTKTLWLKVRCSTYWATIAYEAGRERFLADYQSNKPVYWFKKPFQKRLLTRIQINTQLLQTPLVGQVGFEPTMFLVSQIYSLLPSTIQHTDLYNNHRGMSPVIFALALTGQASGIYRFPSGNYWRYASPLRLSNSIILLGQAPLGYNRAT